MMTGQHSEFRLCGLLAQTRSLLVRNWWRVLISFLVMTCVSVLLDLKADDRSANLVFTVAAVIFQIWLTTALLDEMAKRTRVTGGSGTVIGVLFISEIGIFLGLLLFVVPGVVAFVRWSMVVPIVLSDRRGSRAALTESWHRSEGHFWAILGLLTVVYGPMLVAAVAAAILEASSPSALPTVLFDSITSLGLITGWHAAVAIFLASEPEEPFSASVLASTG